MGAVTQELMRISKNQSDEILQIQPKYGISAYNSKNAK